MCFQGFAAHLLASSRVDEFEDTQFGNWEGLQRVLLRFWAFVVSFFNLGDVRLGFSIFVDRAN